MSYNPETLTQPDNPYLIRPYQYESLIKFADGLGGLRGTQTSFSTNELDNDVLRKLKEEESYIWADSMTLPVNGAQTLATAIALGFLKNPVLRDREISTLIPRGLLVPPHLHDSKKVEARQLVEEIYLIASDKETSRNDHRRKLLQFDQNTAEPIVRGEIAAKGFKLLGLGVYWGANDDPIIWGLIQEQIRSEYVRENLFNGDFGAGD